MTIFGKFLNLSFPSDSFFWYWCFFVLQKAFNFMIKICSKNVTLWLNLFPHCSYPFQSSSSSEYLYMDDPICKPEFLLLFFIHKKCSQGSSSKNYFITLSKIVRPQIKIVRPPNNIFRPPKFNYFLRKWEVRPPNSSPIKS